jgi:predicted lactoylglutathione lyase
MSAMIFINLPVANLQRSIHFFEALGYSINPQFSDESGACVVIDENHIYVMLLDHPKFTGFTDKIITDTRTSTEAIISLSADSREAADLLADTALANGGSVFRQPDDYGFMYGRSFQDPDGHLWEVFYMDMSAMPAADSAAEPTDPTAVTS